MVKMAEINKYIIIGQKYSDIFKKKLEDIGLIPIFVPDNPYVDPRLSGHADLSVFGSEQNMIWIAPHLKNTEFEKKLEEIGAKIKYPDISQAVKYPDDAQLNIAKVGKNLIYGKKSACRCIVEYLINFCDYKPIPVNQGYSKCSTLVVDESSIITQDRGIAAAATKAGLNVLEISPGYVRLDGFEYGFLGGSGFLVNQNLMAFTGRINQHRDYLRIRDFLAQRGIDTLILTDFPVFDIGSAIIINRD